MGKATKFMVVHNDPGKSCEEVQDNWRKLSGQEASNWLRTYYSEEKGLRYCVWLAQNENELKNIFKEMNISWESILPVEEVTPDLWGEKWQQHLAQDKSADNLGN